MISRDPHALYSFAELWRQYRACRRNKRRTRNALAFEIDLEAKLLALGEELRSHRYRPGRSICFITDGPKPREVFAAGFRDRVVHHLLVSRLEPIFEPGFIHDSYACRKGKGTLAASDRLTTMLRRATANGRRPAWAIKLDVASFFTSIEKRRLYRILRRRVKDPELRWLTRVILFHDPTRDYRFQSARPRSPVGLPRPTHPRRVPPGEAGYPVPARKSLFGKGNRRGLPIGNLTSQFWANVYLDQLDQFVKRRLRCRHYLRYVDDFVLLSDDPAELARWRDEIADFLGDRLGLALRADGAAPFRVGRGIDFVGWKTWQNRRLPRRRTLDTLGRRLDAFGRLLVRPVGSGIARVDLSLAEESGSLEGLRSTVASYAGHLKHGGAARAWDAAWRERPWLDSLLVRRDGWQVADRWRPRRALLAATFGRRLRLLAGDAGDRALVFVRVGRFIEFRGVQRLLAERVLGLRPAVVPRAGFALVAGFPAWQTEWRRAAALVAGCDVVEGVDSEVRSRWVLWCSAGSRRSRGEVASARQVSVPPNRDSGKLRMSCRWRTSSSRGAVVPRSGW